MKYIITEDEKSGAVFWEAVGKVFGLELTVIRTSGWRKIGHCLRAFAVGNKSQPSTWTSRLRDNRTVEYTLENPECIVIAWDYYCEQLTIAYKMEYIKELRKIADNYDCNHIYHSTYGCIESAIMSFDRFKSWVHTPKVKSENETSQIERLLAYKAFIESYEPQDEQSQIFFSLAEEICHPLVLPYYNKLRELNGSLPYANMEQACSGLLNHLTLGLEFKFRKNKIGTCYTESCTKNQCVTTRDPNYNDCQKDHLNADDLKILGWALEDVRCPELSNRDKTAKYKLLMILQHSDLRDHFQDSSRVDLTRLIDTKMYNISILEILGINSDATANQQPPEQSPSTTQPPEPQPPQSSVTVPGGQAEIPPQAKITTYGPELAKQVLDSMRTGEYGTLYLDEDSKLYIQRVSDNRLIQLTLSSTAYIFTGGEVVSYTIKVKDNCSIFLENENSIISYKEGMLVIVLYQHLIYPAPPDQIPPDPDEDR